MARAMKEYEHPDGLETWPLSDFDVMLANVLVWLPNGYYGGWGTRYGSGFMIKDGEIVMGCYEEEYRELVTLYNQMYNEGLLHPDFLTLDYSTNTAMMKSGQFGVMGSWGNTDDTSSANPYVDGEDVTRARLNSVHVNPLTNDTGRTPVANLNKSFTTGRVWASAETEYPELVVYITDYLFGTEGGGLYNYGPAEGKDPTGVLQGYAYDEELGGAISLDREDKSLGLQVVNYINPYYYLFSRRNASAYMNSQIGIENDNPDKEKYDAITGLTIMIPDYTNYETLTEVNAYNLEQRAKWSEAGCTTSISVPTVYLSEEDALWAAEVKTVLNEHISAETAKFMVGERSLDEVDEFWAELKAIGIEEYIALYREAYASFTEELASYK